MAQISWIIVFALALAVSVTTMGIGAFLFRNVTRDSLDIAAALPTRPIGEDTNEIRESNRRSARREILLLIAVRSIPGGIITIFGAGFLIWICSKLLSSFHP